MSSPNPVGFELIAYENENQSKVILFFFGSILGFLSLTSLLISSSRSLFQVGSVAGNRNAAERGGRRWPASQYER
jgi:hypothetical protein